MKKLSTHICFFYFIVLATAQAQWINVSFNKADERANYSTIKIASKQMVAVSEDYNSFTESFPEYSYLSNNKTKSWTRISAHYPDILGGALYPFSADIWVSAVFEIKKSKDFALSWETKIHSTSFGKASKASFVDNKNGYLLCSKTNQVIKTNDAGTNWIDCANVLDFSRDFFLDLSFPSIQVGYLVGTNSTITKTINGGNSWFNLTLPFGSYQLNGVDFVSETEGIIVAEAGKIFKTTDGGKTWIDYSLPNTTTLTAIDYIDANLAYACGYSGSIYKTTTSGKTWQQMESGTSNNLLAICFIDSTLGYCSGSGSTVLKLDNSSVPKITKLQANKSLYCEGDSATITYVVNKKFDPSNFFVLQLSDGLGRFNQAVELLSWNGDTSGKVTVKLPTGLMTDQNYRFRIFSTETEMPSIANDSSIQINRTALASVGVDLLPGNKLCEGEGATFTAKPQYGGDKPTFKWFVNDKQVSTLSTYSYKPVNLDKVFVVLSSNSNCVSNATATSQTISMTVNPVPPRPTISKEGVKLESSATLGNQWFVNGSALKDSTKQSITLKLQSLYSVKVTLNGCASPMSALYDLILSTEEEQGTVKTLLLYPNPTSATLYIHTGLQIAKLVVYQSNGIKIIESSTTTELNVANLPTGLYLLEIYDIDGNRVVKKFEKR